MTNDALAKRVMPGSGCYSILGPDKDIYFGDAAILWASLYHVMFSADAKAMKRATLRAKAQEVSNMYHVKLNYIRRETEEQYQITPITPSEDCEARA